MAVVVLDDQSSALGVLFHSGEHANGDDDAEGGVGELFHPCELWYDTALQMTDNQFLCFVLGLRLAFAFRVGVFLQFYIP